jgi:hypothetical protein
MRPILRLLSASICVSFCPGEAGLQRVYPPSRRRSHPGFALSLGTSGAWYSSQWVTSAILPGLGTPAKLCAYAAHIQAPTVEASADLSPRRPKILARSPPDRNFWIPAGGHRRIRDGSAFGRIFRKRRCGAAAVVLHSCTPSSFRLSAGCKYLCRSAILLPIFCDTWRSAVRR